MKMASARLLVILSLWVFFLQVAWGQQNNLNNIGLMAMQALQKNGGANLNPISNQNLQNQNAANVLNLQNQNPSALNIPQFLNQHRNTPQKCLQLNDKSSGTPSQMSQGGYLYPMIISNIPASKSDCGCSVTNQVPNNNLGSVSNTPICLQGGSSPNLGTTCTKTDSTSSKTVPMFSLQSLANLLAQQGVFSVPQMQQSSSVATPQQYSLANIQNQMTQSPIGNQTPQTQPSSQIQTYSQGPPSTQGQQFSQEQPSSSGQPSIQSLMAQLMGPNGNSNPADMFGGLPFPLPSGGKGSGGMKALLPLLFTMLNNDNNKQGSCGCCPNCNCGCSNCNCNPQMPQPQVHTGYSNQMNYGTNGGNKNDLDLASEEDSEEDSYSSSKSGRNRNKYRNKNDDSSEYVDDDEDVYDDEDD